MKLDSTADVGSPTACSNDGPADIRLSLTENALSSEPDAYAPSLSQFGKLAAAAHQIFSFRQMRRAYLDEALLGEGGWDSLLRLYIAWAQGEQIRVSTLAKDVGLPATTVLRWIDKLGEQKLVTKRPNPLDKRSTFLELTPLAVARMTELLQARQLSTSKD